MQELSFVHCVNSPFFFLFPFADVCPCFSQSPDPLIRHLTVESVRTEYRRNPVGIWKFMFRKDAVMLS